MDDALPTTCPTCGHSYGRRRRCYYCQPGRPRSGQVHNCQVCGTEFYVPQWQLVRVAGGGKYCSRVCKYKAQTGVERSAGGSYVNTSGYVVVKVGIRQYRLEHRLVMERHLGRRLSADEHVHHIDGNKLHNAVANLAVMSNADHQRIHDHLGVQHEPRMVDLVCTQCGARYQRRSSRALTSTCCSRACQGAKARIRQIP